MNIIVKQVLDHVIIQLNCSFKPNVTTVIGQTMFAGINITLKNSFKLSLNSLPVAFMVPILISVEEGKVARDNDLCIIILLFDFFEISFLSFLQAQ